MNYAGIGSRETPEDILDLMWHLGDKLATEGHILRTGGAEGADTAFWQGAVQSGYACAEVYLPWKSFNGWGNDSDKVTRIEAQPEAYAIAAEFHPSWQYLKHGAKMLHARNVHQIFGYDVTNPDFSDFVLCYTKDAKGEGGTGQALRIAKHFDIPIYDFGDPLVAQIFSTLLKVR